ncbi:ArsR/SmtB family transcription factor [Nocardioides sp. GXZ039]|uniref:ArsR/SmtB family transcription factor n=1 Tax=Nocardioides sp. GXZ039 TaxID=3136018 RepID=UPI0030F4AB9A
MRASREATLQIHFTRDDLLRTRIAQAPDPMWEVLLSLHELRPASPDSQLSEWRRRTAAAMPHERLWQLLELCPPIGYFPDFLTPEGDQRSLGEQLEIALATDPEELSVQIRRLAEPGPYRRGLRRTGWLRGLEQADAGALGRLGTSLGLYHRSALAPYWEQIEAALAADRAFRAEQYATGGLDALLGGLHPRVRWRPPVLTVLDLHAPPLYLEGRGLLLQPSFFCKGAPTKLHDVENHPVLVYPARGAARLASAEEDPAAESPAAALLGRTRAAALAATVQGVTTSELAGRCAIAVSSASHQATVLREAGLVASTRDGGAVVHRITDLGRRVLAGLPGPGLVSPEH